MKTDESLRPGLPPRSLKGFYAIGIKANGLALLVVVLLNIATPVEFSRHRFEEFFTTFWPALIAMRLGLLFLVTSLPFLVILRRVLDPIRHCLTRQTPSSRMVTAAQQRIINLPFIIAPLNLGLWFLIPGLAFCFVYLAGFMSQSTAIAFFIRAFMVGMLSSAILFFRIEFHARNTLVPYFFPAGELTQTPGTARLSISKRIRAFYRLAGLVPLAQMVLTLVVLYLQMGDADPSLKAHAWSVLLFSVLLFLIFWLAMGKLTRMIGDSIAEPVNEMVTAVDRVAKQDFTARVQVVSNDDLGQLGDAFNKMIQGLLERKQIRDAFGRYVDPKIRDEILAGHIPLDGEVKDVTILFADLRGFTPLTETLGPKVMVQMLNAYFKEMAACISRHNGLILQFLGDEIYAVFGAPLASATHARDAVNAARAMEDRLAQLNQKSAAKGLPPLAQGMGIHTGQVLAANIGSPDRLSYLLVGDAVNLASRLQAMSRQLNVGVIVSQNTVDRLDQGAKAAGLTPYPEPVAVKGQTETVTIFTRPCIF